MYRLDGEEREKKRKRIDEVAAESRKSRGKGRAVSEERGSRSREIGVKTGEDERAAEEEKYSRDLRGTSTETGWQDIKVSIRGLDLRHTTTTKSDSRSGRVSLRSVALFVNAELRARARVTGSSRKASWGFMVPPFGSDQKRRGKEEEGREGGGNRGGGGGWGRRVGQ